MKKTRHPFREVCGDQERERDKGNEMDEPLRILLVEDLATDAELAQREISKTLKPCTFMCVDTREDYLAALADFQPDIIISDYRMPRFDGLTALRLALEHAPFTPVIILTSAMNEDTAVECMKTGAADYVIKEHIKRLGQAVVHALQEEQLRKEQRRAEEENARLEQQLFQSQKIESLGRLAGGVAHDFNNMLTVILGNIELMKQELPEDHVLAKGIREIEKAAVHSQAITRQLLAFSRKQVIEPKIIDLNESIGRTQETLFRLIGEDIDLRFNPGKDLWKVRFDLSQIDQILVNLAVNSRDAMPEGGSLAIRTENVYLDEAFCWEHPPCSAGDYVLLTVSDNGLGMDSETVSHVFEPFFTTKEEGKGTGLGLATVYGIIKQNHGFVDVRSEPGQGAEFRIYIPRQEGEAEPAGKAEESPAISVKRTILLAEDNEMVRTMVAAMLRAIGHEVVVADSPHAAITLCGNAETKIDLLLTDVVMPVMSGKELSDRIKRMAPEIKVLFMSGYTADVIINLGLQEEAHFIQKPFGPADLARKITEAMGEK
jgi:two-component system, cell cycle sensor histidine kinase and response regulator CckA